MKTCATFLLGIALGASTVLLWPKPPNTCTATIEHIQPNGVGEFAKIKYTCDEVAKPPEGWYQINS